VAIHLTDVPFGPVFQRPNDPSSDETNFFKNNEQWTQKEGAYALIQLTKPQSLGHGLNDSPAGLAAWIAVAGDFRRWSRGEIADSGRMGHTEVIGAAAIASSGDLFGLSVSFIICKHLLL
jgi:hypothetical protein